jgi:hypothetical protein
MEIDRPGLIRELHELIEALDRRVPRVEQAGEASIARDAAQLREKAMKRLEELSSRDSSPLADAVRPTSGSWRPRSVE